MKDESCLTCEYEPIWIEDLLEPRGDCQWWPTPPHIPSGSHFDGSFVFKHIPYFDCPCYKRKETTDEKA